MIEGLTVVLSGTEVRECYQRRIHKLNEELSELRQKRRVLQETPPKDDDYETVASVDGMISYTQRQLEHVTFMQEHIITGESYKLNDRQVAQAQLGTRGTWVRED